MRHDEIGVVSAVLDLTGASAPTLSWTSLPGTPDTLGSAFATADKRGRVVLAASKHGAGAPSRGDDTTFVDEVALFNEAVVGKELRILGIRGHDHRSVEPALKLIASRRFTLEVLCTHEYPLDRLDEALRAAFAGADRAVIHAKRRHRAALPVITAEGGGGKEGVVWPRSCRSSLLQGAGCWAMPTIAT